MFRFKFFSFLGVPLKNYHLFCALLNGRAEPRKPGLTPAEMLFSRGLKTTQIYRWCGEKEVYKPLWQKEKKYYLLSEKAFHDLL